MAIEPSFFETFAAHFNADEMDLSDTDVLQENARLVATEMKRRGSNTFTLRMELSRFLEEWDAPTARRFVDASDIAWLFDEPSRQSLKKVITYIVHDLM